MKRTKKYFFVLPLILLLFSATFFLTPLFKNDNATIKLSKKGFSPAGLKIPKGTEVTFVNKTAKPFWPASDLHPDHAIYPEFDPGRAYLPGESWTFKFERVGTFRYHDHLNPIYRGVVVVVDEDIPVLTHRPTLDITFDECKDLADIDDKRNCFTNILQDVLLKKGPDFTFEIVGRLRTEDSEFAADCHTIVHSLGEVSYWKYADDGKLPRTGKIAYCGFGYHHGFMQELGHHSKEFLSQANKVCDHFSLKLKYEGFEETVDPMDQCYHGVGHGLAFFYIPDLWQSPLELIDRGRRDCETLSDNPLKVSNCIYGLFGGLSSAYAGGHGYKLPINQDDPLEVCNLQPEDLKEPCFDSMVPTLGVLYDNNFAKLAGVFSGIEDKFLSQAYFGIGDLGSKWVSLGQTEEAEVVNVCAVAGGRNKLSCFMGLSQGLVRNSLIEDSLYQAVDICRSQYLNINEQSECVDGVVVEMGLIYPQNLDKLEEYILKNIQ